jgi:ribA/ribD-fused uncharacterized protein
MYDISWLIQRYNSGVRLKYVFFWGNQPHKDGIITKSCLSQWWESSFEVEGIVYKTAEHWMMAEKARLFGDEEVRARIIACEQPGEAKALGREVRNFDHEVWEAERFTIVRDGNYHKFSQNKALKTFLVNTKQRILAEASPVDAIWGIGMAADHPNVTKPYTWRGLNLLGFVLMEVRDALISG